MSAMQLNIAVEYRDLDPRFPWVQVEVEGKSPQEFAQMLARAEIAPYGWSQLQWEAFLRVAEEYGIFRTDSDFQALIPMEPLCAALLLDAREEARDEVVRFVARLLESLMRPLYFFHVGDRRLAYPLLQSYDVEFWSAHFRFNDLLGPLLKTGRDLAPTP